MDFRVFPAIAEVGFIGIKTNQAAFIDQPETLWRLAVVFVYFWQSVRELKFLMINRMIKRQFNQVEFGKSVLNSVNVRSLSSMGGSVEIHLDKVDGPVLGQVQIDKGSEWKVTQSKLASVPAGVHDLVVVQKGNDNVDLDWISFE